MCSLNQVNCWKLLNNKTISRKVKNKSSEAIHLTFINLNDNIVQSSSRVDVNTKIIYLCLCTDITLFSFIQVSGIKNKMRFNSFSAPKATKTSETVNLKNLDSEFLHWFSGFADAESNFLITLDRSYIKLRFRINLHKDDIKVLETIKSRLNIGRIVSDTDTSCSYIIEDSLGIELLCNIFKNFPLHTSKKLDFEDFYQAVLVKDKKKIYLNPRGGLNPRKPACGGLCRIR